jgi:aspartyl-tRNA(Asn)/glutamyl-tRNA(Gln) amidotransferase subunit C
MFISIDQVKKIAKLARIKIDANEAEFYSGELSKIFTWIDQLNQVDVQDVKPMTGMENMTLPMRADQVNMQNNADDVLQNAIHKYGCFVVPKVVE